MLEICASEASNQASLQPRQDFAHERGEDAHERRLASRKPGDVWALYEHGTGLPRWYVQLLAAEACWAEAQTNADGWAPLVGACWRGQLGVVQELLRIPATSGEEDPAAQAKGSLITPIAAACDGGDWPTVHNLLALGGQRPSVRQYVSLALL